jgi:hypothetical protein
MSAAVLHGVVGCIPAHLGNVLPQRLHRRNSLALPLSLLPSLVDALPRAHSHAI